MQHFNDLNYEKISHLLNNNQPFWGRASFLASGQKTVSSSTSEDIKRNAFMGLFPKKFLDRAPYARVTRGFGYETGHPNSAMQKDLKITIAAFPHPHTERPVFSWVVVDGHSSAVPYAKMTSLYDNAPRWFLLQIHPDTKKLLPYIDKVSKAEKDSEIKDTMKKLNDFGKELGLYNKYEKPEERITIDLLSDNKTRGLIDDITIDSVNKEGNPESFRSNSRIESDFNLYYTETKFTEYKVQDSLETYINNLDLYVKKNDVESIFKEIFTNQFFCESLLKNTGVYLRYKTQWYGYTPDKYDQGDYRLTNETFVKIAEAAKAKK